MNLKTKICIAICTLLFLIIFTAEIENSTNSFKDIYLPNISNDSIEYQKSDIIHIYDSFTPQSFASLEDSSMPGLRYTRIQIIFLQSTTEIKFNVSYIDGTNYIETRGAWIEFILFQDGKSFGNVTMNCLHYGSYSEYFVYVPLREPHNYTFHVFFYDEYRPEGYMLYNITYTGQNDLTEDDDFIEVVTPKKPDITPNLDAFSTALLITIVSIGAFGGAFLVGKRQKRKEIVATRFRPPLKRDEGGHYPLYQEESLFSEIKESQNAQELDPELVTGFFVESSEIEVYQPNSSDKPVLLDNYSQLPDKSIIKSLKERFQTIKQNVHNYRKNKPTDSGKSLNRINRYNIAKYGLILLGEIILFITSFILDPALTISMARLAAFAYLFLAILLLLVSKKKSDGIYMIIVAAIFYSLSKLVIII